MKIRNWWQDKNKKRELWVKIKELVRKSKRTKQKLENLKKEKEGEKSENWSENRIGPFAWNVFVKQMFW